MRKNQRIKNQAFGELTEGKIWRYTVLRGYFSSSWERHIFALLSSLSLFLSGIKREVCWPENPR